MLTFRPSEEEGKTSEGDKPRPLQVDLLRTFSPKLTQWVWSCDLAEIACLLHNFGLMLELLQAGTVRLLFPPSPNQSSIFIVFLCF